MSKFPSKRRSRARAGSIVAAQVLIGAGVTASFGASAQAVAPTAPSPAASAPTPAAAAATAPAGTPRDADTGNVLQTVIVTGTVGAVQAKRTNSSFSVLTSEDLAKFTPASADDYLRDMPGVFVESLDGVARNESTTRGMVLGFQNGPNPTSGNFWNSILEDGLPVVPVKFSGFQDSNFYRADIGTGRVEAVRGGSAGTSVATSSGAAFNFISKIGQGTSIQTRMGFQGDDYKLSWRQVDIGRGWRDESGTSFGVTGFVRDSGHPGNPSYRTNLGGQIKLQASRGYAGADDSGGRVSITVKHLDDSNSWGAQVWTPMHGYSRQEMAPLFGRNSDMFIKGGQHRVTTDAVNGPGSSVYVDPEKGANYKQDAAWIKWDHDTGGRWSFTTQVRGQKSSAYSRQAWADSNPVSLSTRALYQDAFMVNNGIQGYQRTPTGGFVANRSYLASLESLPGRYEFYDMATGQVMAQVRNNTGVAVGTNYRTGKACGAGTSATASREVSPSLCVAMNNLPNANFQLHGGTVQIFDPISGANVPVTVADSETQDLVVKTGTNVSARGSNDLMLNFQGTYTGDDHRVVLGLFAAQARQTWRGYYSGWGVSPWADGQVSNLGARFVADNGKKYQLSDEGGWGKIGQSNRDNNNFISDSIERDYSPMLAVSWSPGKWDINASAKATYITLYSRNVPLVPNTAGVTDLGSGGVDGVDTTWYDNQYYVQSSDVIEKRANTWIKNVSASVGYNILPQHKVYVRISKADNNINGTIQRYLTQFNRDNLGLFPQVGSEMAEAAYLFGADLGQFGRVQGQVTAFDTYMREYKASPQTLVDGSAYTPEWVDRYVSRGLEAWLDWRITPVLRWKTALTSTRTKQIEVGTFTANSNTTTDDDTLVFKSGLLQRVPKYLASNSIYYDVTRALSLNLRHRYMSQRKLTNGTDTAMLPAQRQFDLSAQYKTPWGIVLNAEVRNLLDNAYIANMSTMLPNTSTSVNANGAPLINPTTGKSYTVTATGNDYLAQLPDATVRVQMNASRSIWLTARYDF